MDFAGVHVVESQTIATEVMADIDRIEGQLTLAAKDLEHNKTADAAKVLALALVRGIDVRFSKDDTPLTAARDAIWLARRSLEENNATQALANLAVARQRLLVYREVLPQDQRQEVEQMLQEVEQLEAQLRQEGTQTAQQRRPCPPGQHRDPCGGIESTVGSGGISDQRSGPRVHTASRATAWRRLCTRAGSDPSIDSG